MKTFRSVLEDFFRDKNNVDFLNSLSEYSGSQISNYFLDKDEIDQIAFAYAITKALPHMSKLIWENPNSDMWTLAWYVNDQYVDPIMTDVIDDKSEVTDLDQDESVLNILGIPRHKGDKLCDYLYHQLVYTLQYYYELHVPISDLASLINVIDDSQIDLKASKYEE